MRAAFSGVKSIFTRRDVRIIRLSRQRVMVVGCDSAGGIGPKWLDKVRVTGYAVGKFTARVALMEVLSVGAMPVCVASTLTVEPNPTGLGILRGISHEVRHVSLSFPVSQIQSTEKNFRVNQTGVGVTVVGLSTMSSLRIGQCRRGDTLYAVGTPHMGNEVLRAERAHKIADIKDIQSMLKLPFVRELMPVGSRGIFEEAKTMAEDSHLRLSLNSPLNIDIRKSAGPATVVLCAIPSHSARQLARNVSKPLNFIGSFN